MKPVDYENPGLEGICLIFILSLMEGMKINKFSPSPTFQSNEFLINLSGKFKLF